MAWVCEGAAIDWTVVSVVAMLRTEGAGEENVLSRPPSVRGAVALVPAPDGASSDSAVSACVASVGALDLFPDWLSWEMDTECLLWDMELCRERWEDRGVEKERWPLCCGSVRDRG